MLCKNIENPKCIVVDPLGGNMYWASWGQDPIIERAALDGSDRSIFVADVGRASGLTIDYSAMRLYWADQDKLAILTCKLSR